MKRLDPNCEFALRIQRQIDRAEAIDEIVTTSYAATWLVEKLARVNRDFKIYNLGSGVKRITTDTETCPCCKKKVTP